MTAIHVLAHIKRVVLTPTPAVDDLAVSGDTPSRDAQRQPPTPERPTGTELAAMSDADFAAFVEDSGIATNSRPLRSPAEPITARPAIPLRGGDRSVGSASVPRGHSSGPGA